MNINYPLLLDGGLSNELERQGCDLNQKLWSAKFLSPQGVTLKIQCYIINPSVTPLQKKRSVPRRVSR